MLAAVPRPASATPENDLDPENIVSDALPYRQPVNESEERKLPFAILPQVGYGPETGPKAGVKFEGRDLFGGSTLGDVGRVYEGADDFLEHPFDHIRYSYGGGVRIGLSSGLVARIDAGFSPEEKGLIYLTFGHTF